MIVFDLHCPSGHRFEGWFGSSDDFAAQSERGLVTCPDCGAGDIAKAPMAPAVPRKENQQLPARTTPVATGSSPPPEMVEAMQKLAAMQAKMLASSKWVGERFAEESRAMHYGERDTTAIHGQATLDEARQLHEEGIPIAPLPFPVAPPDAIN